MWRHATAASPLHRARPELLIPTRREIAHGLIGTWMLVKRDRGGLHWLDNSVSGLRKSFYAAALIAPFYAILLWLTGYAAADPGANFSAVITIESVAYVGAWLIWPVIMFEISRFLDHDLDINRYIVALNWSEIWIMLLRFILVTLMAAGLLSAGAMVMLELVALMVVLSYRFVIASLTLPANGPLAAALTLGDFVTGFAWRAATSTAVAPYLLARETLL